MTSSHISDASSTLEWRVSDSLVAYPGALAEMEERVAAIKAGTASELVWLLEHPPLYTAGTSANVADLVDPDRFPVYDAGRGGQYTYHGPGQRVAYFLLDLNKRGKDVRQFIYGLEEVMIRALANTGVTAERRAGRVGVWVERGDVTGMLREDKIGAIGVRVRQWVTYHGISVNVEPDLSHFTGIVPCGISEHGVTSLRDLGLDTKMAVIDAALQLNFDEIFGLKTRAMTLKVAAAPAADVEQQADPLIASHPVFKV